MLILLWLRRIISASSTRFATWLLRWRVFEWFFFRVLFSHGLKVRIQTASAKRRTTLKNMTLCRFANIFTSVSRNWHKQRRIIFIKTLRMSEEENVETCLSEEEKQRIEAEEKADREHYIKYLEKACDEAKSRQEYAIKQLDTLMLVLSTTALGFILNYIKGMKGELLLAHASMLLFLSCILINLISHTFSMRGNSIASRIAEKQFYWYKHKQHLDPKMTDESFELYKKKKEGRRKIYSFLIRGMNTLGFVVLLTAIAAFILFAFKIKITF
jgi:hypothetical protein